MLINLSFVGSRPTGLGVYARNILPGLGKLRPTVLTPHEIDGFDYYLTPRHLTSEFGFRGHASRLLWTQLKVPAIYSHKRADLLFSPVPEAPLHAGCRYVVTMHDLIPLRFPKPFSPLTPYFKYYVPAVLEGADHIFCNSNATAKDVSDFFNISASKVTHTPLAYDADHFKFLNLPTSNYFVYLGRQDPHKNLQRLIQAFYQVNRSDLELWLVGAVDRRYLPSLQGLVNELGLTLQVKFIDYIDYQMLPKLLNQALALVFPSLWEGFGLPVLEAMACGTPVITSNISSLPEVAGEAAILVNPYKVAELTSWMKTMAEDGKLRSHLRQLGLARAHQFSWQTTSRLTLDVLQRLL